MLKNLIRQLIIPMLVFSLGLPPSYASKPRHPASEESYEVYKKGVNFNANNVLGHGQDIAKNVKFLTQVIQEAASGKAPSLVQNGRLMGQIGSLVQYTFGDVRSYQSPRSQEKYLQKVLQEYSQKLLSSLKEIETKAKTTMALPESFYTSATRPQIHFKAILGSGKQVVVNFNLLRNFLAGKVTANAIKKLYLANRPLYGRFLNLVNQAHFAATGAELNRFGGIDGQARNIYVFLKDGKNLEFTQEHLNKVRDVAEGIRNSKSGEVSSNRIAKYRSLVPTQKQTSAKAPQASERFPREFFKKGAHHGFEYGKLTVAFIAAVTAYNYYLIETSAHSNPRVWEEEKEFLTDPTSYLLLLPFYATSLLIKRQSEKVVSNLTQAQKNLRAQLGNNALHPAKTDSPDIKKRKKRLLKELPKTLGQGMKISGIFLPAIIIAQLGYEIGAHLRACHAVKYNSDKLTEEEIIQKLSLCEQGWKVWQQEDFQLKYAPLVVNGFSSFLAFYVGSVMVQSGYTLAKDKATNSAKWSAAKEVQRSVQTRAGKALSSKDLIRVGEQLTKKSPQVVSFGSKILKGGNQALTITADIGRSTVQLIVFTSLFHIADHFLTPKIEKLILQRGVLDSYDHFNMMSSEESCLHYYLGSNYSNDVMSDIPPQCALDNLKQQLGNSLKANQKWRSQLLVKAREFQYRWTQTLAKYQNQYMASRDFYLDVVNQIQEAKADNLKITVSAKTSMQENFFNRFNLFSDAKYPAFRTNPHFGFNPDLLDRAEIARQRMKYLEKRQQPTSEAEDENSTSFKNRLNAIANTAEENSQQIAQFKMGALSFISKAIQNDILDKKSEWPESIYKDMLKIQKGFASDQPSEQARALVLLNQKRRKQAMTNDIHVLGNDKYHFTNGEVISRCSQFDQDNELRKKINRLAGELSISTMIEFLDTYYDAQFKQDENGYFVPLDEGENAQNLSPKELLEKIFRFNAEKTYIPTDVAKNNCVYDYIYTGLSDQESPNSVKPLGMGGKYFSNYEVFLDMTDVDVKQIPKKYSSMMGFLLNNMVCGTNDFSEGYRGQTEITGFDFEFTPPRIVNYPHAETFCKKNFPNHTYYSYPIILEDNNNKTLGRSQRFYELSLMDILYDHLKPELISQSIDKAWAQKIESGFLHTLETHLVNFNNGLEEHFFPVFWNQKMDGDLPMGVQRAILIDIKNHFNVLDKLVEFYAAENQLQVEQYYQIRKSITESISQLSVNMGIENFRQHSQAAKQLVFEYHRLKRYFGQIDDDFEGPVEQLNFRENYAAYDLSQALIYNLDEILSELIEYQSVWDVFVRDRINGGGYLINFYEKTKNFISDLFNDNQGEEP